jgi:hypothetical protein
MISQQLPSVLYAKDGSVSTERALKQILNLLENYTDNCNEDALEASISDVKTMLSAINRD